MSKSKDIQDPVQNEVDDEISLIDLFAVLLKYKKMILAITIIAMVGIVVLSIISLKLPPEKSFLPNKYTPSADMLINDSSSSSSSLTAALSSSGLGSLAGLAGVSTGSSNSSLAEYLATSNSFLDYITDTFDLIKKWKIEEHPRAMSRQMLKKVLTADYDTDSGVFTISFTDTDTEFAMKVVNSSVDYIDKMFDKLGVDQNKIKKENLEKNIATSYNEILKLSDETKKLESSVSTGRSAWTMPTIAAGTTKIQMDLAAQKEVYTQLKTQYELLKVQMASETPVFQIIQRPEIPDMKSEPSRGKLCIIVTFAAFFIAVFIAFARNAMQNIKNDPDAMAKLKNTKKRKS